MTEPTREARRVTVPNILGALRIAASPWLVVLGAGGRRTAFLVLFLAVAFTDWLDGKLAALLDQRSDIGARLDTVADLVMYGALVPGLAWLEGGVVLGQWAWIGVALLSYAASCAAALAKFGRAPAYHTRSAKTSWLLVLAATVAVVAGEWVWPLRIAALGVITTNLEALFLTRTLDEPREDVPSLFDVLREKGSREGGA